MTRARLDETNFHFAGEFIDEQMAARSWWPREQPELAKEEFLCMRGQPETLNAWCGKWLDGGQMRQLERYLAMRCRASASTRRP